MSSASRWIVWGGEVGKLVERMDWMVWRRERRGGGRVFGGRAMVCKVGEFLANSDLTVDCVSCMGMFCLSSRMSLSELSSFVVGGCSS